MGGKDLPENILLVWKFGAFDFWTILYSFISDPHVTK